MKYKKSGINKALNKKIIKSLNNNFGIENYDENRFGKYELTNHSDTKSNIDILKIFIKKILGYNVSKDKYIQKGNKLLNTYLEEFRYLWENINPSSRELVISLLAYRILGYKKVKLPSNNKKYWQAVKSVNELCVSNEMNNINFLQFVLKKMDLEKIGYNIELYYMEFGIVANFVLEQYAYKKSGKSIVSAESGDVVLDLGGCWGDTALYFAHKVGVTGKVYSFEFIPNNIKLFNKNVSLNPNLLNRINLIQNPISNKTNDLVYFEDRGPSSKVEFNEFEGFSGTIKTISIDDFVKNNNISEINFIKMDIEGAELLALEGAIETIKKFKPKLAIATYHSLSDFVKIPNWIIDLGLGYEIFIDHFTIHSEETVCFARIK